MPGLLQYTTASTVLSVGSVRQQFSSTVNISLSQSSFGFLREVGNHLMVEGSDTPDIQLVQGGYLFLVSEAGQETLRQNYATQRYMSVCLFIFQALSNTVIIFTTMSTCDVHHSLFRKMGVAVELLTSSQLQDRYPWLNTSGIALASVGMHWESCSMLHCKLRERERERYK